MNCQQYLTLILVLLLVHPAYSARLTGSEGKHIAATRLYSNSPAPGRTRPVRLALTPRAVGGLQTGTQPDATFPRSISSGQTSTVLPDGRILLLGGSAGSDPVDAAFIKDPKTGQISPLVAHLLQARMYHTASVLPNGLVLITGGVGPQSQLVSASELFDPRSNSFRTVATGPAGRAHHSATLLLNGKLLLVGGVDASGNLLDTAELWDDRQQTATPLAGTLLVPRQGHTAVLESDGRVCLTGGLSTNGTVPPNDEIIDPAAGITEIRTQAVESQQSKKEAKVVNTLPGEATTQVPSDAVVSLQFSSAVRTDTVSDQTIVLLKDDQPVPARVISAENGQLAFLTPKESLQPDTRYQLKVAGVQNVIGAPISSFESFFTTASAAQDSARSAKPSNPSAETAQSSRHKKSPAQDDPAVSPLQATPGLTALSGQTRTVAGKYLPNVTFRLDCDGKKGSAVSDRFGRFLLVTSGSGHCELEIDGTTAHTGNTDYGRFFPGVDLLAGQTNLLPYTVWMTPIDRAHEIVIPSPTTSEVVITNPQLKGLELHLPPRTVIRDYDGQVITRLGMTRIPIRRPPFPLPQSVPVPIYFTIQPGGSFIEVGGSRYTNGKGAQLIYPNSHRAPAGTKFNFWDYNPDGRGWYSYGTGHVDLSRKDIVPDPGVVIHRFTGAMVASPTTAPPTGPWPFGCPNFLSWLGVCSGEGFGASAGSGGPEGSGPNPHPQPGDPIDPSTGLFVYKMTDYSLPDTLPFVLTRTYRPGDPITHAFGVGTNQDTDMYLVGDFQTYQYTDLITADGGRVHFTRTSPGTSWGNALFVHTASNSAFYGAQITWSDSLYGWKLLLRNGTTLMFPEAAGQTNPLKAALVGITDRYGNTLTLSRDANSGALTKVATPHGKFLVFRYDAQGRITQAQDNLGRTTTYSYDDGDRLAQVIDPASGVTQYSYDANDQMLTITDSRGHVMVSNQYDLQGHVIVQTLADQGTFQFAYTEDSNGNIIQTTITDPNGIVRTLTFGLSGYFSGGQLLSDVRAVGKPEQQTYSYTWQPNAGLLQSIVDPLNRTTSFTYDQNGNCTQTTWLAGTPQAVSVSATYDPAWNQVLSTTDLSNHTLKYQYDGQGNLTQISSPLNVTVNQEYNANGQLTSQQVVSGAGLTIEYSGGLPTSVHDSLAHMSSRTFDSIGRLLTVTDPLGNSTQYEYDNGNRPVRVTDALGGQTQFSYDSNSNLLSLTDARGGLTSFTYDARDRRATRQDPLQAVEQFTYDLNGNVSSFVDRKQQARKLTYDALNRLTTIQYADQSTTTFTYDAGNRVTRIADSLSGVISRTYDNFNNLLSETGPNGTVSYTYNAARQRLSMTAGNQPTVAYSYDGDGRISQITQGNATVAFTYDSAGRRATMTLPGAMTATYGYDAASRLSSLSYSQAGTLVGNLTYAYDANGNVIAKGGTLASTGLPSAVSSAVYNAANQLTQWNGSTFGYDANGNLLTDGASTYHWDARNRLASLTGPGISATFQYDALGRRQAKVLNAAQINFLFDGANAVQEQGVGGSVVANVLTGFGIDENMVRTDAAGTHSYLTDALGSTLALTDGNGGFSAQYSYDPFGGTAAFGASANTAQYTGRENDGTGLYHYRARYYSPALGRFISEDPIGFAGGQSNLYAYVYNNPVNFHDPSGTIAAGTFIGVTAETGVIAGAGATASLQDGTFYNNTTGGYQTAEFGSYGAFAGGPAVNKTIPNTPDPSPFVFGTNISASTGFWASNANTPEELEGVSNTFNINTPLVSLSGSYSSETGVWSASVGFGPGLSGSVSKYPTLTQQIGPSMPKPK